MANNFFKSAEVRKGSLESDNSDYFTKWGSRKPFLTVTEEIDNQIAARPTCAGIIITNKPGGKCTIETYNDGNVPTHERMENMRRIGRTASCNNGASICGVGQIEGLVAGRKSTQSTSVLRFKSVYNGFASYFTCVANGTDYTITTENSGPYPTDEPNIVEKTFEGMHKFKEDDIEKLKALIAIKIYPYAKENPDFTYTFNGEKIVPFGVLYDGVENKSIKRLNVKEYTVKYHGKDYIVKAGAVDSARYAKTDGININKEHADKLDSICNMSEESGGVFVELGGVNVITGGSDSWKFIGMKWHSTRNGHRVWISIPSEGELKTAIFAESPNKSSVNICLPEIVDDGKCVFKEILDDLKKPLTAWRKRDIITDDGTTVEKNLEEKALNELTLNKEFVESVRKMENSLPKEILAILLNKKLKTIFKNVKNKKEEKCLIHAQ